MKNEKFNIENLPPVSDMMRDSGLEPKKQFGQNFLFDLNLTGRIARSVPDIEKMTVFEIGPGPGGLTRALLSAGAPRVIAIEKDTGTKPILDKIVAASDGRLHIIYEDALRFKNFDDYACDGNVAICANLPYNVGTELLINWLHIIANNNRPIIRSMTLMFQKEVALRITARQHDEHYGRLTILTSMIADAKILFDVPNTAFVPKPRITSSVVQIIPRKKMELDFATLLKLEKLTALLFGQRRKMIRGIMRDVDWSKFGLAGTERAEEISPEKFADIARHL